jgi:predicted nucleotidyltransferase
MRQRSVLLNRVKTAVHALSPEAEIILYGSRAKGTARADSDWDFLILRPSLIANS